MGASVTLIKQNQLDRNVIQNVANDGKQMLNESLGVIMHTCQTLMEQNERSTVQNLATRLTERRDLHKQFEHAEKQMVQKRADEKSIPKIFNDFVLSLDFHFQTSVLNVNMFLDLSERSLST